MTSTLTESPSAHGNDPATEKTFIEFFSGIGLVHTALDPLGWTCVYANDNDDRKTRTYRSNFPAATLDQRDIRDIPAAELPTADLATASFPCIDLSQAGGRQGIHAEHSGIVWSFLEHISTLDKAGRAPQFLLLENVPGLLTFHNGSSIDVLLHEIARLGYAFDLVQVDARHFTPQARNRVFIIAVKNLDLAQGQEMPVSHIRRYKVREVFERNKDLPWIFFNFPSLPSRTITLDDVLLDLPRDDPRWWSKERMEYFWEHLETDHNVRLTSLLELKRPMQFTATRRGRRRGLREQIFNLRNDGLASCLRTPKGGSSIQFVVRIGGGEVQVRKISADESGRLQGVGLPECSPQYRFPESEQDGLYGFGDAVCVPAVQWVVENSIETYLSDGILSVASGQLSIDMENFS